MSTKDSVIAMLTKNQGKPISGQGLANALGVSRTAIWKAIQTLREEGYSISAANNSGYTLDKNSDVLSGPGIISYLPGKYKNTNIVTLQTVDSTNTYAKKLALSGAPHMSIIAANSQTGGRGRFGKSFYSPAGTGVYMSVIIRPQLPISQAQYITIAAGIAASRAIDKLTGGTSGIKWVNDIFKGKKKVCGILTEAMGDFESRMTEAVIVGIGINLKTESFPDDIKNVATSLDAPDISRNQLIAETASGLFGLLDTLEVKTLIAEYKRRSIVLGRDITYTKAGITYQGRAVDIDIEGNLVVECGGAVDVLSFGEISLGSSSFT